MHVPEYSGVDSDGIWVDWVRKKAPKRYNFIFQNIGRTGMWGVPVDKFPRPQFSAYSRTPFESSRSYDMYFIDGRFRVASAAASFLHAKSHSVVIVHDFGPPGNRGLEAYKELLTIADVVGGCCAEMKERHSDTLRIGSVDVETSAVSDELTALVILKRKLEVTDQEIERFWHKYKNEYHL